MLTTDYAEPPAVTVTYRHGTEIRSVHGYLHTLNMALYDDGPYLVFVPGMHLNRSVCCWHVTWGQVEGITIAAPGVTEDEIAEQLAGRDPLSPWEREVYDILVAHGGPVQWRDVPHIVAEAGSALEERPVQLAMRGLSDKDLLTFDPCSGLTQGIVTVH